MDRIQELRQQAQQLVDRAEREKRGFSPEEESQLDDILTQVTVAEGDHRERRGHELERLFQRDSSSGSGNGHLQSRARSLGELVITSEQYQNFRRTWPEGLPDRGMVGQALAGIPFGGLHALLSLQARMKQQRPSADEFDTSKIIGLPGEGDLTWAPWWREEFWGGLNEIPYVIPPLMLRSLITVGRTSADLIVFPQLTGVTNAAAFVAPADLKPESDLDFTTKTVPVGTIAHMLTVTRQALADLPALRTYLDRFLLTGLDEVLERAILLGSPPNMEGIVNTPGILDQPFQTDILQTARLAMLKLETQPGLYTQPTAFLLSPEDAASIDLMRDSTGRYYGAGPFAMGPNLLWGIPRVISYLLPAGVGYVGDWREAVLWDRETGTISASDSHKDYFQRNLVAILAEMRAAFGVLRPEAFCKFETAAGAGPGNGGGGEGLAARPSPQPAPAPAPQPTPRRGTTR